MTRATLAALEQLEDLAAAVSTSTGWFFFLFFSSSGFDVGKMADAASCCAAALLPVQTSELRNAAELLRKPGRWEEWLPRLHEHRSIGSSSHLCGRPGDVQDAWPFLGGLESWRGPRRSAQTLPLRIDGR